MINPTPTLCSPTVPPKPPHLQSPVKAGPPKIHTPIKGELVIQPANGAVGARSPNKEGLGPNGQDNGVSVAHIGPARHGLRTCSSVRGITGGSGLVKWLSQTHISPARNGPGTRSPARSTVLGVPSPAKRSIQNHSPLREGQGGRSPGKLSPRTCSRGLLRTPSPVQGKARGYSPVEASKSWLGKHKSPVARMEGKQRRAGKSCSVPELIIHIDKSRC